MRFLLPLVLGLTLLGFGWWELRLSQRSGSAPLPIEVAELEARTPPRLWLTLGQHVPLYDMVIYVTRAEHSNEIQWAYYPVVSPQTYQATLARTAGQPDEQFLKELPLRVLVRTPRYHTREELLRAMQDQSLATGNLTGMVVNSIVRLGPTEREMLQKRFPDFDESRVVIFEADRKPTSPYVAYGALAGGLGLCGLSLALVKRRRSG